jgi:TfoX/Sxy family transcriptional regulator of competence genes
MAYDEGLVDRVREALSAEPGLTEKRMFGSYGFLLDGNMCAGVRNDELIARVPIDKYPAILARQDVSPFPTPDRPMRGWIAVGPDATAEDDDLARWVQDGVRIARTLPPK